MIKVRGNPALHFVDRYVGIPAIALAGNMRKKHNLPSDIKKIGLLKGGAIGDTVLLSAITADLREAFPTAELIIFAGESNYEMACLLDGVDSIIKAPAGNVFKGIRAMRSAHVDVLIDFGQWTRLEALFTMASKSAFTIGFRTAEQHRHHGFDLAVEHSRDKHEIENYRDLVRGLGISATHPPFLKTSRPIAPLITERDYAVCHHWPGGCGSELKQWPVERWIRLMGELIETGLEIVLTGSSQDHSSNESIVNAMSSNLRGSVKNVAGLSLDRTVNILGNSKLVVSVNTGVMHIAAALGVPTIGLQGPTSSKRWGPIGKNAVAIDSTLKGCGYLDLGWEFPAQPPACMEAVPYESVHAACKLFLQKQVEQSAALNADEPTEVLKNAAQ